MSYIIQPDKASSTDQLGGKAGALAALAETGLPIPAWIVLSPTAFEASLSQPQREALAASGPSAEILQRLDGLEPAPTIRAELEQAVAALCPTGELVAVRSSAPEEDGLQHAFAGQLDSFLFVPPREVANKVAAVWRSGFGERVLAYRREHGLSPLPRPPAVLIQRMIAAEVSGVAFSADPVSGRRGITVIAASYGLGTAVVSGEVDADAYHVDRTGNIIRREIAHKGVAHCYAGDEAGGLQTVSIPAERATRPALSPAQVQQVADLARRTGRFFGRPQDIEWAIAGDQLYLLQSRPITTLTGRADPDGALNLWDNSNIAESYPGLTTPLTFSFARRAYEEVYRQFCRMMGVPAATIAAHHNTFRRMLGFIRGRIYYNLLSWYRVLALLPGYQINRRFMEQMMGVKEKLPDELLPDSPAGRSARWKDGLRLLRTVGGLIANYFLLPRRIDHFYERLNRTLGPSSPNLEQLRSDELAAYYRDLEGQLLTHWDAPLINDFFAMIFYGILRKLAETWAGDANGTLQNDLLSGSGGLISVEPAARLREMARLAAGDPDLVAVLCEGALPDILEQLEHAPELAALYRAYLDRFGDRCLEELKLESATLDDDPLFLLRSAGQLAARLGAITGLGDQIGGAPERGDGRWSVEGEGGPDVPAEAETPRQRAEQRVRAALARRPLRRVIFNWVLENARRRVRDRENLRFERTRVFGRVRRIFLELGRRFQALDLLAEARDIFYLEVEEALGFIEGTTTTTDLKGLTALRRAEIDRYRTLEVPAGRFETRGIVHQGHAFRGEEALEPVAGDRLQGIGCCPGLVRGRVRIVTDPRAANLQPGDILVAERTDPGWVMLFPFAAGLLVEHGSLLSHSAIVAREMGIPAIVSLPGITGWLDDGDWVELDGGRGVVTRISEWVAS